jgi:hypothetical protein
MSSHKNSHVIEVFRAGSFLARAQGPEVQEHFSSAKISIGSYWSRQGVKIASGLSFEEEELLLPKIIDTPKEDKEFRKKLRVFYVDIDTKVPAAGLKLEIGLAVDNSKPVSEENWPIELMDYLRWRHMLGHPKVAKTKEISDSDPKKWFYIFDRKAIQATTIAQNKEKDDALAIYLKLKAEKEKIPMMLTLLNHDPKEYTPSQQLEKVRELAETDPAGFIAAYEQEDLEIRFHIQSMIRNKVLNHSLSKYYRTEDKKLLANSLDELILWFTTEDNANEVSALKALNQEAMKAPVVAAKRVTQPLPGKTLK